MSHPTQQPSQKQLLIWLAIIGGTGFFIMSIALGVGVIQGASASSSVISLAFFSGLAMLILASVGWFGVAQPHKHFDDINQPHYTGHDHNH
ncbi:MAG: hypothetical protein ACOYLB_04135 [Phototrophicaceae bacterium]